jgi:two-component system cell cycle response regulator
MNKTVLVIEDNPVNMKLVKSLLQIGNINVLEAPDAGTGIRIAREQIPDLILMDIQLPDMDGLSATRVIREDPALNGSLIIALTAHAMQDDEEHAMEVGCNGYITKPIDTRSFLDKINGYLNEDKDEKTSPGKDRESKNKILIVDDQPLNVKLLTAKLSNENFKLFEAQSGEEALEKASSFSPDLILLDIMMPGMDGYEVTRRLKADPGTRDIPVILITALDGSEDKAKGMEAGAEEFINKPVNTSELLTRVNSMLKLRRYKEQLKIHTEAKGSFDGTDDREVVGEGKKRMPSVLIVEDDLKDAKVIQSYLETEPYKISVATNGEEAISKTLQEDVDIIFLDVLLPRVNGFEVCRRLKENEQTRNVQIVMATCLGDLDSKLKGIELGADDYLIKPIDARELRARTDTLLKKKAYLDRIYSNYKMALNSAINDGLTGVYNHPYFKSFLELEIIRAERNIYPGALIMIDIDDFKKYNDSLGHWVGDVILRDLAQVIKSVVREIDLVARYGGEEFAVVLPYCKRKDSLTVAGRIKEAIHGHSFANEVSQLPGKITVSMGIAVYPSDASTLEDLIKRADSMLYKAKEEGKNKICVYEEVSH